ncbi:MAG: translation initiation factor IF-2 [Patescibacteria group bacterium]
MNLSTLAKNLGMRRDELIKKMAGFGFKLRKTATTDKISERKAKEIIKKIEREKRQKAQLIEKAKEAKEQPKKIYLPSIVRVKDLAEKLNLPVVEVIKKLMENGVMATINEEIDFETAAIVASDFKIETEEQKQEVDMLKSLGVRKKLQEEFAQDKKDLKPRPPVITVMGHVDHGKTKLLDTLRKTNVVEQETGGITQHIGAYQVKKNGKLITFLDTPGHEAFSAMRERGAKVTDIVILVVAADDGVKPQTIEAINHAKKAGAPIVVAINKIDKPEADPMKVKKQLSDLGLVSEEWGGETICVEISAKFNKNLDKLLEMILLVAEMQDLKANPETKAIGTIIESKLEPKKGPTATVLIQNGTLKLNDPVTCGNIFGTIRAMENYQGKKIDHAKPSAPVKILGLESVPQVGDILQVEESREKAKAKISQLKKISLSKRVLEKRKKLGKNIKRLNIILVADVQGSVGAILDELAKIESDQVEAFVLDYKAGKITESDVMMAAGSEAIIYGFDTPPTPVAKRLAEEKKVKIKSFDIIYKLLDDVKVELNALIEPEVKKIILGKMKVLAIFRQEKKRTILGGGVISGKFEKEAKIDVVRENKKIGEGEIKNLQQNKVNVDEIKQGKEGGIEILGKGKIKEGDILVAYKEEVTKRIIK